MSAEMRTENFVMGFDIWLQAGNLDCLRAVKHPGLERKTRVLVQTLVGK
jgi:hypothetical protein